MTIWSWFGMTGRAVRNGDTAFGMTSRGRGVWDDKPGGVWYDKPGGLWYDKPGEGRLG